MFHFTKMLSLDQPHKMKSATTTCNAVILTDTKKLIYNKYMYTKLNKSH